MPSAYDQPVILRCTRKLLDVIKPATLADPLPDPEDWYANLLWFDRRKCLLLTHSATLFTIFEADVTVVGLRATRELVTRLITRELDREGLPAGTFGDPASAQVIIARTADRSVLGCMNDMAFACEVVIADSGGLAQTDLTQLNRRLQRNITSPRRYQRPIDLARQRVAPATATARDSGSHGAGTT